MQPGWGHQVSPIPLSWTQPLCPPVPCDVTEPWTKPEPAFGFFSGEVRADTFFQLVAELEIENLALCVF